MNGFGWNDMGGWGWLGIVMMLLFWFGLVALSVWAVIGTRPAQTHAPVSGPAGDAALTTLRERFAHGEITAEEFKQARQTLDASGWKPES